MTTSRPSRVGLPDGVLAGEHRAPLMPDWLANLAGLSWRVLAIVALVIVLWNVAAALWTVTAAIAIAVVVAAAFAPVALRLRERGMSRTAAAAVVWVGALTTVGAVLLALVLVLMPKITELSERIATALAEVNATLTAAGTPSVVGGALERALEIVRGTVAGFVGGLVGTAAGIVTVVVLAGFLVFFLLQDGDRAWVWVFQNASAPNRDRITEAGDDALARVGGYLRGTTILSAAIAVSDFVFMALLGVPLAGPLALLAFLAGYIPYFGGIVTTLAILIVTFVSVGTPAVVTMLVLIAIRNAIVGYSLRPMIYGRTVSLHPAVVLVALPAGYQLAGIVGVFAAVPVVAVLMAVADATVAIVDPGPQPDLPAVVPPWLDRMAQWSWRVLVALGMLALVVLALGAVPLVLIPLVIAMIFAATLLPLVSALQARGWTRGRAAAAAVGGAFLGVAALLLASVASVVREAQPIHSAAVGGASDASAAAGGNLELVRLAVDGLSSELARTVVSVAGDVAGLAVLILLSALLAFYGLRDGTGLWRKAVAHLRADAVAPVEAAAGRAVEVLGGYMVGTGAVSFVGAASQFAIMAVLGIPLALPIAVLSFFLGFIPYVGGFLSTGLAFLVTLATGSPSDVAVMAVFTVLFNVVQGNVVAPLVYGRTVHLHPAIVLVACPAGAAIGGVAGMFLVVPLLGVVAATWRTGLAVMALPPSVPGRGSDGETRVSVVRRTARQRPKPAPAPAS
ncbi:MAG TPA: AI-2E family transporter [Candidatus Limnocylindrales bacterium]|nr:AI-2E family transporter [Candidatus Limnocylindrales bacterium]